MSSIHILFYNFCYYMFFLAVAIRTAVGQAPASAPAGPPKVPALAPTRPPNVTAILEKGGRFDTLIKLMLSTPVANQIKGELKNTHDAMTIFAPTDAAFAALPAGTLNGLTEEEKRKLVQFHIVPSFISLPQFQTVSNPLSTKAGDAGQYGYPLYITTFNNTVTISTGVDNTTIAGTFYSDKQLAIYQVNDVLLPQAIFGSKPPAPAPAPTLPKKEKKKPSAPAPARAPSVHSGDMGLRENAVVALVSATAVVLWL